MAKEMRNKQFDCRGLIQEINTLDMAEVKFKVTVSNDSHCTVSFLPMVKDLPLQYCVDFTEVLKALEVDNV